MRRIAVLSMTGAEFKFYGQHVADLAGGLDRFKFNDGHQSFDIEGFRFDRITTADRMRGADYQQMVIVGNGYMHPERWEMEQIVKSRRMGKCQSGSMWFDTEREINGNRKSSVQRAPRASG